MFDLSAEDVVNDDIEPSDIEILDEDPSPTPRVKAPAPETWRTAVWLGAEMKAALTRFHEKTGGLEPQLYEDRGALLSADEKRQHQEYGELTDRELTAMCWNNPEGAVRAWQQREAARNPPPAAPAVKAQPASQHTKAQTIVTDRQAEAMVELATKAAGDVAFDGKECEEAFKRYLGVDPGSVTDRDVVLLAMLDPEFGELAAAKRAGDDQIIREAKNGSLPCWESDLWRLVDRYNNAILTKEISELLSRLQSQQRQIDALAQNLATAAKAIGAHTIAAKQIANMECAVNLLLDKRADELAVQS